jgi:hypothetical protein
MKTFLISIILTITLLVITSCDSFLNKYPLDAPSDATFLSTEQELEAAITACYGGLWLKIDNMPMHLCFDQISDLGWDRNVNTAQLQIIGRNAHDSKNATITEIWKTMYTYIAECNYVIENMSRGKENINENTYKRVLAEAQFLRALYYHFLVELWGDVPLITKTLTLESGKEGKTKKSQIVDFLIKELKEAASNLPDDKTAISGRATYGAAYTLLSRVALYNSLWDDAILAAQKVMELENSNYMIDPDYMSLFQYEGMSSKEIIFSVQYLLGANTHQLYRILGSRKGLGVTNKIPAYQTADSWECTDGLAIDKSPLYNPQKPFDNRDPRLQYTLAVPGSEYIGFQFETHGDSTMCWDYLETPYKRVANDDATNAYATFSGMCWRKYVDIKDRAAVNDSELNTIIFRYAEILLNFAEAKIEKGEVADGLALNAINKVRARESVNMPPITASTQGELRNAVRRERKYEFTGEGLRLFDIRRWQLAEMVMTQPVLGRMKRSYPEKAPRIDEYATAFYDNGIPIAGQGESTDYKMRVVEVRSFDKSKDYLWPIPYLETETNPNINNYE